MISKNSFFFLINLDIINVVSRITIQIEMYISKYTFTKHVIFISVAYIIFQYGGGQSCIHIFGGRKVGGTLCGL